MIGLLIPRYAEATKSVRLEYSLSPCGPMFFRSSAYLVFAIDSGLYKVAFLNQTRTDFS